MNLLSLFSIPLQQTPDKPALVVESGQQSLAWTYAELERQAVAMAGHLHGLGVRCGDRVALYAGNSGPWVVAYLALLRLGAIMVPINLRYRQRELEHILSDCTPRMVLTDRANAVHLHNPDLHCMQDIACLLLEDLSRTPSQPAPSIPVGSDDTALIMYTSGTTGHSKGAMISHNNIVATVTGLLSAWAWQPDDVLLLALPLFHVHGLLVGLTCGLARGATILLHPSFQVQATLDCLTSGVPTLFFAVPTIYFRLMQALDGQREQDFRHMRLFCSGSAPLAAEDHRRFQRLTGHVILERYGMTETGMNFSNPYVGRRQPGTVGLPLPGVSARIVDQAFQDVPAGTEGQLLVRGSNVFSAYWEDPEATAASFVSDQLQQRWFCTGDLGILDPETGYLTLLGRSHELILSGGFNVYPREIEEVLVLHAGIQEAAVVGRPDPEWGQVPVAYVVVNDHFDAEALEEHCRQQLASFKLPRAFHVVNVLPRNAMGKLQKFLLPSD